MTICIGALCKDRDGQPSRAVVVASDRMVTLGNFIEFEHEVPKFIEITSKVVALVAGDALKGTRLVREVVIGIPAASPLVQTVTEAIAKHYIELRQQQLESDVFTPRGITMQDFYQGQQQRMLPQIAGAIDNHVAKYDYGVELLIAGVDDSGAHVYSLRNPGGAFDDFQQIGYAGIGSGALHAVQSMIGFGHTGARSIGETIFKVFVAKRRAEAAPGVGKDTDLAIIVSDGITRLNQEQLTTLEDLYQEYQSPLSEELKGKMDNFKWEGQAQ